MLLERLLENLALRVEAFATCQVAPGWRLRLPALDWVTFHYALQGEGEIRGGDGQPLKLAAGSLALVPPQLVHGIECGAGPFGEEGVGNGSGGDGLPIHRAGPADEDELSVVCGRVQVVFGRGLGLFDRLREALVLDFSNEPDMQDIFQRLLEELRSPRPGSTAMVTALMNESLIHVLRRLCSRSDCSMPWLQALEDPELGPALDAILEHPEDPHTVATLAERCYMSRSTFARHFKEAFERPPMEYLREVRLRKAAQLLRQEPPLPVATVASRVGFGSRSQFSRAFKDYFDRSPSEFTA